MNGPADRCEAVATALGDPPALESLGVVVIGRNEGQRLRRCLSSVIGGGVVVVYVDSGSTDGSAALALSLGAEVVELDRSAPFTAARARNAGFERLRCLDPNRGFVQFVDGDCEVVDGWLERGLAALLARPEAAVVCGRRRERFPERSIYNRLADLEWGTPLGDVCSCGGDALVRVSAFEAVGGFDATVAAGEEPELCARLRRNGWVIWRIAAEMTRHDLNVTSFRGWWRRQVRSGYGSLEVTLRLGGGPFARQARSARVWTVGWVGVGAALTAASLAAGGTPAAGWTLVGSAMIPILQTLRLAAKARRRVGNTWVGLAFGFLTILGKWGELAGQARFLLDRWAGRRVRLIEYKGTENSVPAIPEVSS